MTYTFAVDVDWDGDGFGGGSDTITSYVREIDIDLGIQSDIALVANVGHASIRLNNDTRIFSPSYSSGSLYGKLLPGKAVRIQVTDGSTYTVFRGVIASIRITPGVAGERDATFECVDAMDKLNNYQINLPLQESKRSDVIIRKVVDAAFSATAAYQHAAFTANPADAKTFAFNLSDGTTLITYRYKTAISQANDVLIGATALATITNLAAAINNGDGSGTTYYAGSTRGGEVTASVGTAGETITISTSAQLSLIGTTGGNPIEQAQSFTPLVGGSLNQFQFTLGASTGSPTGNMTWEIRTDPGGTTGPTSGASTLLATSTITPTASALNTVNLTVVTGIPILTIGVKYWVILRSINSQSDGVGWNWNRSAATIYAGGNRAASLTSGVTYIDDATRDQDLTVTLSPYILITAVSSGTWANVIPLSTDTGSVVLNGSFLAGGTDAPSGLISYQTGVNTFDYAGDTWQGEKVSAFNAIEEVTKSEFGLFFVQRDGTVTFWNRDELFKRITTAASVTLSSEEQELESAMDIEDIYTRVEVQYTPRTTLSVGVVAQSSSAFQVPGLSGTEAWNGTVALPGGGNTVQKLPFTDPTTGKPMGAKSIITPLVATTDWTANEARDGSGPSYTGNANLTFSLVINGDSVVVSVKNTALGPLYITMLKVRGTGIVRYSATVIARENSAAITSFGKRILTFELPLGFAGVDIFADALAQYLLSRYKDAAYRVRSIGFRGFYGIGATSLFSLNIGDVVTITDYQTALSAVKHMVMGVNYHISGHDQTTIRYYVKSLGDVTYGIWDDATYGLWDTTFRWAI